MKYFFKSFVYAVNGIWSGVADQLNLKVQIGVAILVVAAGYYYNIMALEWCVILLCIALVLGLEMMNSAIESLVDLVTLERKPLAGRIKDIAAGAVLLVSLISVVIGVVVFRKYIVV